MARLDQTVRRGIRKLEREVEKELRDAKRKGILRLWKDKKVVSVKQWENMGADGYKQLEYLPDDFIQYPFLFFPNDLKLREKRVEWYQEYISFLESVKNPALGRDYCRFCLINQDSKIATKSIREIILKTVYEDEVSPCGVVNIFECPYEQWSKDYTLLNYGKMWEIVDNALHYAHGLTTGNNEKKFEVDFENDEAYRYYSRLDTRPAAEAIDKASKDFRISKVPIKYRSDIYNALTNRKSLEILLDQYIESIANDEYYSHKRTPESEKKAERIRHWKKHIIKFFTKIKPMIKLDDLRGVYDKSREDEEKEKARVKDVDEYFMKENPEYAKCIMSGTCVSCNEFANIHCINCDMWVCVDHWKSHGIKIHGFKEGK